MRNLSNTVAGLAGVAILLGAFAATPTAYGWAPTTHEDDATSSSVAPPDLGACDRLPVPEGHEVSFHTYAEGVQIYRWDGTSWVLLAPDAQLYADAGGHGNVGSHYAGPTWESVSGSKVVGRVEERCTPDPTAIPWLKLKAVYAQGPGIFARTTYIQRVNTVGGLAPATPGAFDGEVRRVPYTAEYYFYRAQD